MMFDENPTKRRWPRSQRFALSETGINAELSYRNAIVASRDTSGRASFDTARQQWAQEFKVDPDDGLYLGEVASGARSLEQIVAALDTCGKTKKQALVALDRLIEAGLIAATVNEARR